MTEMAAPIISNSMETMLQLMMTKMNEGFENINQLQTKMNEGFENLNQKIDRVDRKLDMFRGETNERLFRAELVRKYGEEFAKPFNIQGLHGLARLVITKKVYANGYNARALGEVPDIDLSEMQRMENCTKKFVNFIYSEASRQAIENNLLKNCGWTKEQVFGKLASGGKKYRSDNKNDISARDKILAFARADPASKQNLLRQDNGIAMLFFTAALGFSPIHELEIHCRDKVIATSDTSFFIQIGEIKSSRTGLSDAVEKARVVLSVLDKALRLSLSEVSNTGTAAAVNEETSTVVVIKQCVVALPSAERDTSISPPQTDGFQLVLEYV